MKAFLQSHWKLVLVANLLLGVSLWFGFFTNLSLRGTLSDILFPAFTTIFAVTTLGALPTEKRKFGGLAYIPSCGGGCLYLFMGFIMLIPPFTLAFLFGASEIANEVRVQQIASPNHTDFAEVYFRPVGAYTGGSGRIYIRVVNKYMPFVERDIYAGKTHTSDGKTTNYVKWLDENTLYISEVDKQISVGSIQPELPSLAIVPLMIVGFIQGQIRESQLTAPLDDIPIYPTRRENESTSYWDVEKTSERIYFLPQAQIEKVYDWHLSNLSKSPWEIINSQIVPDSDPIYQGYNIYCITAQKSDGNHTTIYYFEIAELHKLLEPDYRLLDPDLWDVRVIVATPNPDSIYCWLK